MPKLRLLGRAVVLDDEGRTAAISSRRHPVALLALLTVAPSQALSRSRLVGFLWPHVPEKTGRNRLTTCVHRIRRVLGTDVLRSVGSDLQLDSEALPSDVGQFRTALEEGDVAASVALYQGAFLDGFWLEGAREFEDRVERERDRLERAYQEALETLAREADTRGHREEAVRWWRERLARTPLDSRVAGELVEALALAGSRGEALRVAQDHAETLERELGARPDPAFLGRVEEVARLRGTEAAPGGAPGDRTPRLSLAVLPFDVSGATADARVLADGLLEDLLTDLASIPELVLIAGRSARAYQNTDLAPSRIARELGVAHLVLGSAQVFQDRLRLRVQLVDARRDIYLWAERYDRQLTPGDLLGIQSDLAGKIARTLRLEIDPDGRGRRAPVTEDLQAYRLYARGRAFMSDRSRVSMWRAVESFERALERDDGFALAWAGLSDALVLLGDYHHEEPDVVRDRGERAARRALALDPALAEAHASLGNFLSWQRRLSEAIEAHRHAAELRPGYAHAHQWLCWVSLLAGHPEVARRAGARATVLDPFEPEAGINLAAAHLGVGDASAALAETKRVLALYPAFQYGRFVEGLAHWSLGHWTAGSGIMDSLTDAWAEGLPHLGRILSLAMTGATDDARAELSALHARMSHLHRALALATLGERTTALSELDQVSRPEWPDTLLVRYHPQSLTAAVHNTGAYHAFLARVNVSWGVTPMEPEDQAPPPGRVAPRPSPLPEDCGD